MGPTPAKVGKVIPAQSVNEKLTLVAGLIPGPIVSRLQVQCDEHWRQLDLGSVVITGLAASRSCN